MNGERLEQVSEQVYAQAQAEAAFYGVDAIAIVVAPDGSYRLRARGFHINVLVGVLQRATAAAIELGVLQPVAAGSAGSVAEPPSSSEPPATPKLEGSES